MTHRGVQARLHPELHQSSIRPNEGLEKRPRDEFDGLSRGQRFFVLSVREGRFVLPEQAEKTLGGRARELLPHLFEEKRDEEARQEVVEEARPGEEAGRQADEEARQEGLLTEQGAAVPAAPVKGVCPKCGKHIGRGIGFHTMKCKGASDG